MNIKITFTRDISAQLSRLILESIHNSKVSGYNIGIQLAKVRQIHHSNLSKDKVDSIANWVAKQGSIVKSITVDGVAWSPAIVVPVKEKKARAKKVA